MAGSLGEKAVLGVVEWRVLSYLAIMNIWRGVTADMVGGALALREQDLEEASMQFVFPVQDFRAEFCMWMFMYLYLAWR